ncbi:MAG TPA: TIM barrel protein [Verrucomicrobiales bacterium]|nr:TIM barrel protein [Verrucomicrobiales bacterium]
MSEIPNRLALSTCWCSHRHTDGYEMLTEIRELGFLRAELSHGIRLELTPGILRAVEEGWIKISSVHNFCPLPATISHAAPNLFQPSARKNEERALWLLHSERTLEFAARVGAPHVVMHSGSMDPSNLHFLFGSPVPVLEPDFAAPDPSPPADSPAVEKAVRKLRRAARSTLRRVHDAYLSLGPATRRHGLVLGAENREGILEFPIDDEFQALFDQLPTDFPIGYWHDTGHARIKHLAGRLDHETHLAALADRLIGFHLHDVSAAGKDHQVPGSGSVDFAMVRRYIRPHHTLVLEPSPRLTRDEILQSRDFLLNTL